MVNNTVPQTSNFTTSAIYNTKDMSVVTDLCVGYLDKSNSNKIHCLHITRPSGTPPKEGT